MPEYTPTQVDISMQYRRCGRSGVLLPLLSLGLWHNFGDDRPLDTQRAILRRAFDLGITHFDLANNSGPPYGSAERNFGILLRTDFGSLRDELIISSKAGWDMWPGPYGDHGSRKYLLASLDQSLGRMGLDYVDIFYHHRFDPDPPLEETLGTLDAAVSQGKALYVGVSPTRTSGPGKPSRSSARSGLRSSSTSLRTPCSIAGSKTDCSTYSDSEGVGCIAFSPLAQGILTDRYLNGIPEGSRASERATLFPEMLTDENMAREHALNAIAKVAVRNSPSWPWLGRSAIPTSPLWLSGRAALFSSRRTSPPWTTWTLG